MQNRNERFRDTFSAFRRIGEKDQSEFAATATTSKGYEYVDHAVHDFFHLAASNRHVNILTSKTITERVECVAAR
jgi:hypothetical protein